jgi:hypothetical protein
MIHYISHQNTPFHIESMEQESWKQPLAEMQENVAYIRPKVVRPFPGTYARGSNVLQAALFYTLFNI